MTELREKLAALEHEQWAYWARWVLDHYDPALAKERWEPLIATPYEDLTEELKDKDREWADKVLEICKAGKT